MSSQYGRLQAQAEDEQPAYQQASHDGPGGGAAYGFTMLAGVLLVLAGLWAFLTGLAAILTSSFFAATPNYYYNINITGWGWIHLALGVVLFATGCCLFARQAWARVAGIFVAVLSAVMNFLFIPRYPFWSVTMIALDLVIIWALAAVDRRGAY